MRNLLLWLLCSVLSIFFLCCDRQAADRSFDATVENPEFRKLRPRVLFDQAHNNIHTMNGTYKPFMDLIVNDGFNVYTNGDIFTGGTLKGYDILVISNPKGREKKYDPAFTEEECSAVEAWVRRGGNLLLIADHHPIGSAAEILSKKFGVSMSKGFTNDSLHCDTASVTKSAVDGKSQLVFSRAGGSLGDHPITQGRDSTERIDRIMTFTGQSLAGPEGSVPFLTLSSSAYDVVPDSIWDEPEMIFFTNTFTRFADPVSAEGRSQGIALGFGKGRVVVLGEAAMLTAQKFKDEQFGMQVPGIDNKQLAMNIMRWLARAL